MPFSVTPQDGPQSDFLATASDIAVYGGAAGGGKSWSLLVEPLRHLKNKGFGGVIFRRESPQITSTGGLWDASMKIYPQCGAKPRLTDFKWTFPSGMNIRFTHLEEEKDVLKWQGSEVPFVGFDELTHFTEYQFWYLLSRNRSLCGVKPYIRATCNPDATSWVKVFLAPWVDRFSPIKAKSGEILYMVRDGDSGIINWFATFQEAADAYAHLWTEWLRPEHVIKSVTFVAARIFDNKILLRENPEYLGSLMALPPVERARLLEGDWDVLPGAGKVLDRAWFEVVEAAPVGVTEYLPLRTADPEAISQAARERQWEVRCWDFAASVAKTKGDDPDWTVGAKLRLVRGRYYVVDVARFRATPGDLETRVRNVASQDGADCVQRWEEEGGASGKIASGRMAEVLAGFDARPYKPIGDKVARAMPFAAQAQAGNVKIVKAPWNEGYLTELHHFPDAAHDDCVDSTSGAFNYLVANAHDITVGPDIWST